jgi:N-acetylglucosamine-6-phosphate deacetylase
LKVYRDSFKLEGVYIYDTPSRKFWRGELTAEGGLITSVRFYPADNDTRGCSEKHRIIPAPVDIHTHGRNGVDFAGATMEEMSRVREDYAAAGTLTLMPTVASAPFDVMLQSVKNIRASGFDGVHVEGRWLNVKRRGAHNPALLAVPSLNELAQIIKAADGIKLHITVAPELEGGEAFVRAAVAAGATVAAGHTDMSVEQAYEVLEWGITAFTHTFNAMPPLHHRQPGVIAAALCSDAYAEFICDGVHLHPEIVKLASRLKNRDKVVLITDSMAATGCPDGVYSIAGQRVTVNGGRALTDDGAIAGSTLSLYNGMLNYMNFSGAELADAVDAATINPARMVGLDSIVGSIEVGKRALVVELD